MSIISFSGRKSSGKSTLVEICKQFGYEELNFADELKLLVCQLLSISLEELNQTKDDLFSTPLFLTKKQRKIIENEIGEKAEIHLKEKPFSSIREILQYIGTDLIRKYNPSWHLLKIKSKILPDKKYCFGDTRFINEKEFLEELGAECWFIIRPSLSSISNHSSETSLTWDMFDSNVLINHTTKKEFKKRWKMFLTKKEEGNIDYQLRKELFYRFLRLPNDKQNLPSSSKKQMKKWCWDLFLYSRVQWRDPFAFYDYDPFTCFIGGVLTTNGYIKKGGFGIQHPQKKVLELFQTLLQTEQPIEKVEKEEKEMYQLECQDPFIIENVKMWVQDSLFVLPEKWVETGRNYFLRVE